MAKMSKRWLRTEKAVCRYLGIPHVGGPGEPDCSDGAWVVEVKDHDRPLTLYDVREIAGKDWAAGKALVIYSTSGFTEAAIEYAEEHEILLLEPEEL